MENTKTAMEFIDSEEPKKYIIGLFVFILIMCGNYLGELLPCKIQYLLVHSRAFKHILGVLTLIFFVILAVPELKENKDNSNEYKKPLLAVLLYALFLVMSKINWKMWVIVFFLFTCVYISYIYRYSIDNKENKDMKLINTLKDIETWFVRSAVTLTGIGFVWYYISKKKEYKKDFSTSRFFWGKNECKHNRDFSMIHNVFGGNKKNRNRN